MIKKILVTTAKQLDKEYTLNIQGDFFASQTTKKLNERGYKLDINKDNEYVKFTRENEMYEIDVLFKTNIEDLDSFSYK